MVFLLRLICCPAEKCLLKIKAQLFQTQLFNEIHNTTPGALVSGFGFKVSDLIANAIGFGVGAVLNCPESNFVKSEVK